MPNVVGWHVDAARVRLESQPLTPQVIYKPAKPGQRLGIVVRQFPSTGTLSSFGRVTIVLAKPLHGTVPQIVGLRWQKASAEAEQLKLHVTVHLGKGKPGRVLAQIPAGGRRRGARMTVSVTVGTAG